MRLADLTTILRFWCEGNDQAFGALVERVYGTLKVIAAERLRQMGGTATLSATELLHEALIDIMPTGHSSVSAECVAFRHLLFRQRIGRLWHI